MEVEVVKSNIEQQVESEIEREQRLEAAREMARKRFAFAKRQLTGKLTFAEYKEKLSEREQRAYKRAFGVPLTATELRGAANRTKKNRRLSKIARQSRATNRSR